MTINTLISRRILSVTSDRQVVLEGNNLRVLLTGEVLPMHVGCVAVCQALEVDGAPAVVVLGLLEPETHYDPDAPLEVSHGAAMLRLHADGRIELKGEAIKVDSAATLSLLAARIDLN